MNDDLRSLIREKLTSDGSLSESWAALILVACDGPQLLEEYLSQGAATQTSRESAAPSKRRGAYLTSITVEGFRGIGPRQTIQFKAGPGLTIVTGRNGSGKSSFAEGLEVLFTGDSHRWVGRAKVWKEGWRSLHNPHPTAIEADVLVEGQGTVNVSCTWENGAPFESIRSSVQPKGKTKTSLDAIGWKSATVAYRPFLSYDELGSMLDEGPSKLYDALSIVLGLEDLVAAQNALAASRLKRQQALDAMDQQRIALTASVNNLLSNHSDDRAVACLQALTSKPWQFAVLRELLVSDAVSSPDPTIAILTRALSLEPVKPEDVALAASALRSANDELKALVGSDAENSRRLVSLLTAAVQYHQEHGGEDCPVCGTSGALSESWADATRTQIERLKGLAAAAEQAHSVVDRALKRARDLLTLPSPLLEQLVPIAVDGLEDARAQWTQWRSGIELTDLAALADHIEDRHGVFASAVSALRDSVGAELRRREDLWRPIATSLAVWLDKAEQVCNDADKIPPITEAEKWLKEASGDIRNQRFTPIADKAMAAWQHLRQQSNVSLGKIELAGTKSQRRVTLDVTVDGIAGAALSVMSQGELHSLALSLFLPRATLPESPFRFVVIDDPVQSMDPARVDGLARAFEEVARTRQVIVFTHDDRLSEAVRRLNIDSVIMHITRRPKSVVEIRTALDPIRAHIEDALALVHTTELPKDILRSLVPGFCRSAIEAACIGVVRRRRLAAGREHDAVEQELADAGKLMPLAALALFDDKDRGADVMKRLNQYGPWAGDVFKRARSGAHEAVPGELKAMIEDTEKLTGHIAELK